MPKGRQQRDVDSRKTCLVPRGTAEESLFFEDGCPTSQMTLLPRGVCYLTTFRGKCRGRHDMPWHVVAAHGIFSRHAGEKMPTASPAGKPAAKPTARLHGKPRGEYLWDQGARWASGGSSGGLIIFLSNGNRVSGGLLPRILPRVLSWVLPQERPRYSPGVLLHRGHCHGACRRQVPRQHPWAQPWHVPRQDVAHHDMPRHAVGAAADTATKNSSNVHPWTLLGDNSPRRHPRGGTGDPRGEKETMGFAQTRQNNSIGTRCHRLL